MTTGLDIDTAALPDGDDEGLTSREILVAAALEERSLELGALYRWSARTVKSRTPPGWVHLVAHFVRDLLNRLPEHFDVPAADPASIDALLAQLDAHWGHEPPATLDDELVTRIQALLGEYRRGGENQDQRAEAVMRAGAREPEAQAQVRAGIRAWRRLHTYFQKIAHLRSEEKSRTLIIDEDEVAERFDALTALLAVRIGGEGFFETLGELDELAAIEEPTQDDADRAASLMRDGLADRFLRRIESPGWLAQLRRLGVFSYPPQAIREGGYIQAFGWSAADYLVRIADTAPADVLAVIEAIPTTDNERIHISFVQAALRMPADQAASAALLVRPWLEAGEVHFGLPEAAADLAGNLAANGKARPARRLMEAALGIRVVGDAPPQVVAHVSDWQIADLLGTHFQKFVAADPVRAFGFLAGILQRLTEALHDRLGYAEDSSIIRPAIEDHAQNTDVDARAPLLVSLRDAGELILREHPDEIERILNILQSGPALLRRLALHLIRIDESPDGVARRRAAMLDAGGYQELEDLHERFLLLERHFADLAPDDRAAVGEIIAAGPDLDQRYGPAADEDETERRAAVVAEWKLRWLAAMSEHIPETLVPLYGELTEMHGTVEHPEFLWWHSSWVGPTSPEPQAQLSELPVEDVIHRLVNFEAPSGPTMPSPEGLGRVFANVVEAAPDRWAEAAAQLESVPPIYVRHFFSGLSAAVRAGKPVSSWSDVLLLAEAVMAGGPAPRIVAPHFDGDEQPGHARDTIARLLHEGMRTLDVPYDLRERVWALLREIAVDPDPDAAYDVRRAEAAENVYTPAVATVRGAAMDAVMLYPHWVAHHEQQGEGPASLAASPEFTGFLEERFPAERSPGVLAVIGSRLPGLIALDQAWVEQHLELLLPPGDGELAKAVWRGCVAWTFADDLVFSTLGAQYRQAVHQLPTDEDRGDRRYLDSLGEHLALAAARGLPDADGMLAEFLARSSSRTRRHVIGWLGRVMHPSNHLGLAPEMPEHRGRLTALWEQRLEATSDGDAELQEFGWWYASGIFDSAADVDRLVLTANKARRHLGNMRAVLVRAADAAPTAPSSAAELAESLMKADLSERLRVAPDMIPLLRSLLADDQTRDRARTVINELGEAGFHGAGSLLEEE